LEQKNVFICGDPVYKGFDYYRNRNPLIIPSYQCSPDIYLDASLHLIEDVTEIINWQDPDRGKEEYLRIISYTFVKGIVGHFTSLAEGLLKLHIKSLVYGDIRFANVVFNEGGDRATIIDFDYSGVNNRKTYPTRFNLDITDGRRHSSVGGEKVLKLEHDVFSLQWMCKQYHPKNGNCRADWMKCVEDLTVSGLETFVSRGAGACEWRTLAW